MNAAGIIPAAHHIPRLRQTRKGSPHYADNRNFHPATLLLSMSSQEHLSRSEATGMHIKPLRMKATSSIGLSLFPFPARYLTQYRAGIGNQEQPSVNATTQRYARSNSRAT